MPSPRTLALTLAFAALSPAAAQARDALLDKLTGSWGLPGIDSCGDNAQNIEFSEDGKTLYIVYREPVPSVHGMEQFFRYEVKGIAGPAVRMRLEGEPRTTDAGQPVEWDLMLASHDSFCWRRTDWEVGTCTDKNHRCGSALADEIDRLRVATAQIVHRLEEGGFDPVASSFDLPTTLSAEEQAAERARLARSLAILVSEFGAPADPVETDQSGNSPPRLAEITLAPLGQALQRNVRLYRYLLFSVYYARLGPGYFRVEFLPGGRVRGLTFSLPESESERVAHIAAALARETGP